MNINAEYVVQRTITLEACKGRKRGAYSSMMSLAITMAVRISGKVKSRAFFPAGEMICPSVVQAAPADGCKKKSHANVTMQNVSSTRRALTAG